MCSIDIKREFLPEEIIIQILARLPVKSLFQFKSVCKTWYKIVSDRYFIQLYNSISLKNPMMFLEVADVTALRSRLLCVEYTRGAFDISLDFLKERVKIRASCNGLLCCSSIASKGVYYVCNPITREFRVLPQCRERPRTRFHPDEEATLVGIGCDVWSDKFNVVLAGYQRRFGQVGDGTFVSVIYDSRANKWRKLVLWQDEQFTPMNKNQVVYSNGALHWLTCSFSCILVLDLAKEGWRKMYFPSLMCCGSGSRMYLLELDGCVSVVQISDSWMSTWVLEDYETEEWRMVDRVSLRCIRELAPGMYPISQNGEYLFMATHKQILVYVRSRRVWKEMYSVKNSMTLPLCFSAHAFRSAIRSCRWEK